MVAVVYVVGMFLRPKSKHSLSIFTARLQRRRLLRNLHLRRIDDPRTLSLSLNQIPGVVENGLFLDICDVVIVGDAKGNVEVRDITKGTVEKQQIDMQEADNIFSEVLG